MFVCYKLFVYTYINLYRCINLRSQPVDALKSDRNSKCFILHHRATHWNHLGT